MKDPVRDRQKDSSPPRRMPMTYFAQTADASSPDPACPELFAGSPLRRRRGVRWGTIFRTGPCLGFRILCLGFQSMKVIDFPSCVTSVINIFFGHLLRQNNLALTYNHPVTPQSLPAHRTTGPSDRTHASLYNRSATIPTRGVRIRDAASHRSTMRGYASLPPADHRNQYALFP